MGCGCRAAKERKKESGGGVDDKETCNGWCGFSLPQFLLQD